MPNSVLAVRLRKLLVLEGVALPLPSAGGELAMFVFSGSRVLPLVV